LHLKQYISNKSNLDLVVDNHILYIRTDNCPFIGWYRDIKLKSKDRRKTNVSYVDKLSNTRCEDLVSLKTLFSKKNELQDTQYLLQFDYRPLYCVCQTPEDKTHCYAECSYGQLGCNGWIHPGCVGFGNLTDDEVNKMPPLVCPLCTNYLSGSGEIEIFRKSIPKVRYD
jgi:hypothetical protein